ncbi:MAG: protein-(glutamine-N5) methyltransferase, release factor-specific [Dehalococcoidia bacterium]|nr:protein-(glutamine-N5) methyltransferase, release factor-specific [Dehalococcoidia bacterium]
MILQALLEETRSSLASHGVEEASLEADLLLMKAVGLNRSRLYSSPERPVTLEEREALGQDLARRLGGEPWPYICGYREFYGLNMAVSPGVFIPRPETELLVELALELARSLPSDRPIRIADVGTGSGAIAISLAAHLPQAVVYATDVSTRAIETARHNCQRHRLEGRVIVLEGNLLEPVPEAVDIVVSNSPYVPRAEIPHLPREVRFEPREALDGGLDGLEVVRSLIPQALAKLRRGGGLVVEISPTQRTEVCVLAGTMLPQGSFSLVKDLAGRERALLARVD